MFIGGGKLHSYLIWIDLEMTGLDPEKETLEFISGYCKKGEPLLCGNSVWQDRRFLIKHMPDLEDFFHYRIIDVSSIKELAKRWYPSLPPYEKKNAHLALSDIKESINELKYYREKVFLPLNFSA